VACGPALAHDFAAAASFQLALCNLLPDRGNIGLQLLELRLFLGREDVVAGLGASSRELSGLRLLVNGEVILDTCSHTGEHGETATLGLQQYFCKRTVLYVAQPVSERIY